MAFKLKSFQELVAMTKEKFDELFGEFDVSTRIAM